MVALEQQGRLCHVELWQQPTVLGQTREVVATHSKASTDEHAPRTLASAREDREGQGKPLARSPRGWFSWSLPGPPAHVPGTLSASRGPCSLPCGLLPGPPAHTSCPSANPHSGGSQHAMSCWATPGRVWGPGNFRDHSERSSLMTTLCQQPPCGAYVPSPPRTPHSCPQTKVGGFLPQQRPPSPTAASSQAGDAALAPAAPPPAPPGHRLHPALGPGFRSAPSEPPSPARGLTLSYQQRMLSWPHMQLLEEQSSMHTQYCGESVSDGAPSRSPRLFPAPGTVLRTQGLQPPPREVERTPGPPHGACRRGGGLGAWAHGPKSAGKRGQRWGEWPQPSQQSQWQPEPGPEPPATQQPLPPPSNCPDQGPLLTCRWVMFLSMFMGDVTQF